MHVPGSNQFMLGPYRLDAETGELARGEATIKLTPKATAVLLTLGAHAGELVGKKELFAKVWTGRVVSDAALTSCIQELRNALQDDPRRPHYLETLHRRGYRLLVPLVRGMSVPAARSAPPPRIVGRQAELQALEGCLEHARAGERRIVFVVGEAGIGKTTLIESFVASAVRDVDLAYASGSCAEHYGASEPYLPLLDALTSLARGPQRVSVLEILRRRAPSWLAQLPALLDDSELERVQRRAVGATRERMLRELADAVEGICAVRPLLLRLEDLHWSDVSTLDWLGFVARRTEPARLLVLAAIRSIEELPRDHPLAALGAELPLRAHCRILTLPPLQPHEVGEYLAGRFSSAGGTAIDLAALAATIHARTEGNPLFVVTVTNDLIGRGALTQSDGVWTLRAAAGEVADAIPDDLRRLIELQLGRLHDRERTVLQAASAAGAQFSAPAVAAALGEPALGIEICCAELAGRGQFLNCAPAEAWPDRTLASRYCFRHALYRAALYDRLPAGLRAAWHARIGDRLEAAVGSQARARAAELATHFDRGCDVPRAVLYHQAAGDNATRRNAPREAIERYRRALELLAELPDSHQRAQREIELNIGLGPLLLASEGWGAAEAERAYSRAEQLCARTGATRELFTALWGLWMYRWGHGELDTAHNLGGRLLALAERTDDNALHLQAHHSLWATLLPRGELLACIRHATAGASVYTTACHGGLAAQFGHHDAGACAWQFHAWALALHGDVQRARELMDSAMALTREIAHPFSHALALFFAAALYQFLREPSIAERYAESGMRLAAEHDFKLIEAWSSAVFGWCAAVRGEHAAGVKRIVEAMVAARATGTQQFQTLLHTVLADACRHAGRAAEGLTAAEQGLAIAHRTDERFCEAELLRLRGELEFAAASAAELADCKLGKQRGCASIERAADVARAQGAHLFELRAAVSLLLARECPNDAIPALRTALQHFGAEVTCVDVRAAHAALAAL
jgi:DNA-binding winged helix-turn-helix (wHTH) protein